MDRVTVTRDQLEPRFISANMEAIRRRVADAAKRAGRDPDSVEVLAATKYVAPDGLGALAEAGITLIGENRAQDLIEKYRMYGDRFVWDFIGRLQSNKVRQVLPLVRLIHSVETISAVREIEKQAQQTTDVLLQVNIGEEASKCGIIPTEVDRFLEEAERFSMVNFTGLMTMPPLAVDPETARPAFAALRDLADRLSDSWRGRYSFNRLSMGTSNDFSVAVEEGATIIRIGNILYGQNYSKG
jgi:pyridoxal phosphate enzyme (YggS family)